jgi:DNA gyrase inhibitor GyrI
MADLVVRMVELGPMRVAAAHGFGERPEAESWEKLMAFAKEVGLLDDLESHRVFGFNNPDPSPGSPNYGYDSWITVGTDVRATAELSILEFEGGLYAVTRCDGVGPIGDVWKSLVAWREAGSYHQGQHQWLEEVLNPGDFVTPDGKPTPDDAWEAVRFDLYLPVVE